MMSGSSWSQQFALMNFLIADSMSTETTIINPSALKMLEAQLNSSLKDKGQNFKAAFSAYWIAEKKVFSRYNSLSAAFAAFTMINVKPRIEQLQEIVYVLNRSPSVAELSAILKKQ